MADNSRLFRGSLVKDLITLKIQVALIHARHL